MSLNLSPVEFASEGLAGQIRAEINRFGVPTEKVTIEILETSIVSDEAAQLVQELSDLGVRLAIDDFGTGYSSLAYLTTLPVDELKIDRSFVAQLDQPNDRSRTVVAATITLGHQLGLSITAEGVETKEQEQVLAELSCDDVQGYLRSRPVMAETVEALIAEQARPTAG
jgi:EAL domain-containing protein (putative c-di-GMP-specific phosphodiesterase class I)